jgi:hypothetical protein
MGQNLVKEYVETKEQKQPFMLKDFSSYRLLDAQMKVAK